MIKDIPYIRSIMFVSRTAPARYERAGLLEKIRLSTGIVRGLSGYMQKHRDDSGASEQHRELMEYQRKQNAFRCDMALSELWRHYTAFLADGYGRREDEGSGVPAGTSGRADRHPREEHPQRQGVEGARDCRLGPDRQVLPDRRDATVTILGGPATTATSTPRPCAALNSVPWESASTTI